MSHKSKTQRAKASAARQQRKANRENGVAEISVVEEPQEEKPSKLNIFKKSDDEQLKADKKAEEKARAKKNRFKFFKDVHAEMRRVTWPSKTDVLRWTGVVVLALLFFGVFVAGLDNLIVTPLLVAISGIG